MLIKQIEYFISIVDEDSFTEAAEKMYISQSAISQAVASLEKELGTKLLIRKNRKFSLTLAGQYFYRKGKRVLSELGELRDETIRIGKEEEGALCIGYLNLYAGPELSETIAEFAALYPEVSISTVSGTHEELYQGLSSGRINLALNDQRRVFSEEYMNVELTNAKCLVEISERQISEDTQKLDLADLVKLPCILVAPEDHRAGEEEYYRNILGFSGDFLFANSLEEARLMVVGNRGFLLLEAIGRLPEAPSSIRRIPLYNKERRLTRKFCLFWQKKWTNYYVEEFAENFQKKLI